MRTPAWWLARSTRERTVITWAGGAAVVLLVFALVWLPLERARGRIAGELPGLRDSVAQMRAQAAEVQALRAMPARAAGAPIASLAASGTLAQGLPGARVAALGDKRVKIAVDDAAWSRVVEWIAAVQSAHGLAVEEASVEALASAGRVRAELVLAAQ